MLPFFLLNVFDHEQPEKPTIIDLTVFYAFFTLIVINTVWFSFSEKAIEIGVTSYEEEEDENGEKKKRAVSSLLIAF